MPTEPTLPARLLFEPCVVPLVSRIFRGAVPLLLIPLVLITAGCGRKESSGQEDAPVSTASTVPAEPPTPIVEIPVSEMLRGAVKARIDDEFAAVVLASGKKTVVPLETLSSTDINFLIRLSEEQPLATGKSSMVVVQSTDPLSGPKKTIEVSKTEGTLETVQLCAPHAPREQIGGTCMLYARVHWLDIAGYYTNLPEIFKIINGTPPDHPWTSPKYVSGLDSILTGFKTQPVVHPIPPGADSFEWARKELRRGRPILAALPREIVQVLPPDFLIEYPWSGGSVGHQIVVNGFTIDRATGEGTFHIVNTWAQLLEFDIPLKYATGGALVFEASMSPVGEEPNKEENEAEYVRANEKVEQVTFLKSVGSSGLFEVTTNFGVRKVIATDAAAARRMIEER